MVVEAQGKARQQRRRWRVCERHARVRRTAVAHGEQASASTLLSHTVQNNQKGQVQQIHFDTTAFSSMHCYQVDIGQASMEWLTSVTTYSIRYSGAVFFDIQTGRHVQW